VTAHVLGLDAGATKTVCLLADESGKVLAQVRGPGANLQASGEIEVEKVLHRLMEEAIDDRAIVPRAICLGIAGVDRPDDAEVVRGIMRRIGYQARCVVVNDALVALVAGAGDAPGIVVVAGTGSIAYGRNERGLAARAGGWGYVLGDEGSGYWIGRLALRAVVREADGRGRPTRLTPLVLSHFGVSHPDALVHEVYHRSLRPPAIAALATAVQRAHEEGDEVADSILEGGTRELLMSAASVASRLQMEREAFPFVLAGGILKAVPWLASQLAARLPGIAPRSHVVFLEQEPALGAVHLAVAAACGTLKLPSYTWMGDASVHGAEGCDRTQ
jgi:N-acetylglucosamine kinase-like BadF-type ATPase